jgi:MFS family permease
MSNIAVSSSHSSVINSHVSERRRIFVLILVLIPVFIGALDLTIVSAILPEVLTRLNIPVDTNLGLAAWSVTGYLLAYTVSMIITGRLSDLVGRRSVYLICLAIFIFGSYWVATAHEFPTDMLNRFARQVLGERPDTNILTLYAVIIGRVIQALGAGAMVPVSMALVADLYPPERRAQPVGIIGAVDTLGWVLGHLYGGLMVNWFSTNGEQIFQTIRSLGLDWPPPDWRTLFFVNVPIGIVAFILTYFALRGVEHPVGHGRFDYFGGVLVSGALIALNFGLGGNTEVTGTTSIDTLREQSSGQPINPLLIGLSAVMLIAFVLWTRRQRFPLLELHIFRSRNVTSASITNLLVGFCLMLGLVSVPLLVNLRAQDASAESIALAAERAGILLSALTVPMAIAAIPGGWLANRFGYRTATAGGMLLATAGFLMAGLTWRADTPELIMAAHMILVGVGLGLTISPIGTAVINEANEDQRGVSSALVIILRLVGMTIAISSLTTFALNRIAYLVSIASANFAPGLSALDIERESINAYFNSGIQVIGEMLIVGAIACLIAVVPSLLMRGKPQEGSRADDDVQTGKGTEKQNKPELEQVH